MNRILIYQWAQKLLVFKHSPHDEHRSSGPRPVKLFRTSKFFSVYLYIHVYKYTCIINLRIRFGPVNSKFHFENCKHRVKPIYFQNIG